MKTDVLGTRVSQPLACLKTDSTGSPLLVRIYPISGIEQPLVLSDEPLLVGRDPNASLLLSDDSVSRRHALIEPNADGHLISDLGSTNGTYINDRRIYDSCRLTTGDRVRFGNQIFKYLNDDRIEAQYHEVIFHLMTTDGLTSAHNKRYFLETMEREIQQSRRTGTPTCVLMLDLDKFKSINDTYGHLAGDAVLVEFARRTKAALRSGDLFARYGGEEFAMLLTRTNLEDAAQVAERVRLSMAAAPVTFEEFIIPVTVSIGIFCDIGSEDHDASSLIAFADEQLYVAKQSGRNQVRH